MQLAYLILAHKNLNQVYTLIDTLYSGREHFYIHIDRKCSEAIDPDYEKKNYIHFLPNRRKVYWGGFSIVQATNDMINEAANFETTFDYCILLSGQCFPIKSSDYIHQYFQQHNGKLFIEQIPIPHPTLPERGDHKIRYHYFFDQLGNLNTEHKKLIFKITTRIEKLLSLQRKIPTGVKPYFGSQWWALPSEAIIYILTKIKRQPKLIKFFRYTWAPDELFFQTLVGNSRFSKKGFGENLHYIDWNTNGPPKMLTSDDLEILKSSKKLFARKVDEKIINEIKKIIKSPKY